MRLVVAQCTVTYSGRLSTVLPSGVRLVMVKADGCVAIHADAGAYKPLNWMMGPNYVAEAHNQWVVTNSKGESLTIDFEEVFSDSAHDMASSLCAANIPRRSGPSTSCTSTPMAPR